MPECISNPISLEKPDFTPLFFANLPTGIYESKDVELFYDLSTSGHHASLHLRDSEIGKNIWSDETFCRSGMILNLDLDVTATLPFNFEKYQDVTENRLLFKSYRLIKSVNDKTIEYDFQHHGLSVYIPDTFFPDLASMGSRFYKISDSFFEFHGVVPEKNGFGKVYFIILYKFFPRQNPED